MRGPLRREAETEVIGIAWYRPDQWQRLLEVSADRADLEDTWYEWERGAQRFLNDALARGTQMERVSIDVEELVRWCKKQKRPVDSRARSEYTARLLRERHTG